MYYCIFFTHYLILTSLPYPYLPTLTLPLPPYSLTLPLTFPQDMKRLEAENLELSGKLREAERQLLQMERQVADLHVLKTKVRSYSGY